MRLALLFLLFPILSFAQESERLPRLLIVGDSISLAYNFLAEGNQLLAKKVAAFAEMAVNTTPGGYDGLYFGRTSQLSGRMVSGDSTRRKGFGGKWLLDVTKVDGMTLRPARRFLVKNGTKHVWKHDEAVTVWGCKRGQHAGLVRGPMARPGMDKIPEQYRTIAAGREWHFEKTLLVTKVE